MKFSLTVQGNCDLLILIEVTAWQGLIVLFFFTLAIQIINIFENGALIIM